MVTRKPFIATMLFILIILVLTVNSCSIRFTNPSPNLESSDLEGMWTAHYSLGTTDTITLKPDGTFRQIFRDADEEYVFDSGRNHWTLEKLPNGIIRLHLYGGRYYLDGISLAEANGRKNPDDPCLDTDCAWGLQPRSFYDPFGNELLQMVDELILVAQVDAAGNLILHHVWTSSDRGFLLIDKDREIFYRETSKSH